jgi:hypothetical protein
LTTGHIDFQVEDLHTVLGEAFLVAVVTLAGEIVGAVRDVVSFSVLGCVFSFKVGSFSLVTSTGFFGSLGDSVSSSFVGSRAELRKSANLAIVLEEKSKGNNERKSCRFFDTTLSRPTFEK